MQGMKILFSSNPSDLSTKIKVSKLKSSVNFYVTTLKILTRPYFFYHHAAASTVIYIDKNQLILIYVFSLRNLNPPGKNHTCNVYRVHLLAVNPLICLRYASKTFYVR